MKAFPDIKSQTIKLLDSDVDTDQIIPARFLRTSESAGLGRHLFYDRRFTKDGQEREDFPLSRARYRGEAILIAGANFGCGSSREHAPWALKDFGLRAIVAPSFADIFFNNCLINGILPIVVDEATWRDLAADTGTVSISLQEQILETARWRQSFKLDPFARFCLLEGLSELDYIVKNVAAIARFEAMNRQRIPSIAGL